MYFRKSFTFISTDFTFRYKIKGEQPLANIINKLADTLAYTGTSMANAHSYTTKLAPRNFLYNWTNRVKEVIFSEHILITNASYQA